MAAFITARLAEDEHFLRVMCEAGQRNADNATPKDMADAVSLVMGMMSDPAVAREVRRWEDGAVLPPTATQRLLEEIEAKREIVAECTLLGMVGLAFKGEAGPESAHRILCRLAAIWHEHPDYDPAWKP